MKQSKFHKKPSQDKIEDGNAELEDHLFKKYQEKTYQVIESVKEIGLPDNNEQIRIITMKSFNSVSFIELIANTEGIEKAILVIFAINLQAAKSLLKLYRSGKIREMELIVSSVRNAGYSIKSKAVELIAEEKGIKLLFVNSHAKISAIKTGKWNHYVLEGSGNFSFNGRIEQYIIDNDEKLYNFTNDWIVDLKKTYTSKDLTIINE